MQAQARDILSNPEAAAQSLWTIQHSYATSELFKNVTTVRAEQLAQMYGKQWQHSWGILASSGDLVELDVYVWLQCGLHHSHIRFEMQMMHTIDACMYTIQIHTISQYIFHPIQATSAPGTLIIAAHAIFKASDGIKKGNVSLQSLLLYRQSPALSHAAEINPSS